MIHALICTRSKKLPYITYNLRRYLSLSGIRTHLLINQKSIYSAFTDTLGTLRLEPEDTIIFCHDDIEIVTDKDNLLPIIDRYLTRDKTGFVGVAGTTCLEKDAVWWDKRRRDEGLHRGFVFQGKSISDCYPNYFGPHGQVVVLDGVFLACKAKLLKKINLEKPSYFEGDWDFYDIYYTSQATKLGYKNRTIPITLVHNSPGFTRETWNLNRIAFIEQNELPLKCS